MTANEVYEKMILGEIKPENALAFFKATSEERLIKMTMPLDELRRPLSIDEQLQDMISHGSFRQQREYKAKQITEQIIAEANFYNKYIKDAQDIIAGQKEEAQPDSRQSDKKEAVLNKEVTLEQSKQAEDHILMQIMKSYHPLAYTAVNNGLSAGIIEFENNLFNFKCQSGCVGAMFREAGYTAYKQIAPFILINGKPPAKNTLSNSTSNPEPKQWEEIKQVLFQTMTK